LQKQDVCNKYPPLCGGASKRKGVSKRKSQESQ
jgi:hypothetical protein